MMNKLSYVVSVYASSTNGLYQILIANYALERFSIYNEERSAATVISKRRVYLNS